MKPYQNKFVSISDAAKALQMPQETYLPTGLDGVVTCPVVAQPPVLRVDWTKDGEPLDLSSVITGIISTQSAVTNSVDQTQMSAAGQRYSVY